MNVQNRPEYAVLLSTLSPSAQLRYFKEHGQPFPLVSEKPASAKAYKPLDHFSAAEREEIRQEMETLARWQEYRRQPGRTAELDAEFVELLRQVKKAYPQKSIWAFSGYLYEKITSHTLGDWAVTQEFLSYLDVLVDGPFVEEKKNLALRFRGSENQRLIDMPATLASGKIVLWEDWQTEGKGLKEWKK